MQEFRCTRNSPYTDDCPGRADRRARQGYYLKAETAEDACLMMAQRFPQDSAGFTADPWPSVPTIAPPASSVDCPRSLVHGTTQLCAEYGIAAVVSMLEQLADGHSRAMLSRNDRHSAAVWRRVADQLAAVDSYRRPTQAEIDSVGST